MQRIVIAGKPIPKKSVRLGKHGAYNSQKKIMDDIRWQIKSQHKGKLLAGAVKLEVIYFMPIPASLSKKKRALLPYTYHITRPDSDNLTKLIKDCMSGIVYKDDSQVADGHYKKIYSEEPRTEIIIEELT